MSENRFSGRLALLLEACEALGPLPQTHESCLIRNGDGSAPASSLFRIDASGFGCVLLSREALEALDEPYLRDEPGLNGDFTFYKQCRLKGVEVWGDASVICGHHQVHTLGLMDFAQYYPSWEKEIAVRMPLIERAVVDQREQALMAAR